MHVHVHVFNSESRKEALLQITVRLDGKTKCSSRVHAFVGPSFSHFAFVPVRGRGGGNILLYVWILRVWACTYVVP